MDDRVSAQITRALIEYMERTGADVDELLSSVDYSRDYLCSPGRWLTNEDLIILFAQARKLTRDALVPYWTGRILVESRNPEIMNQMIGYEKGLQEVIMRFPEWIHQICPNNRFAIENFSHNELLARVSGRKECLYTRDYCLFFKGMLEGIVLLYGCSPETVREKTCMVSIDRVGEIDGHCYRIDDEGQVIEFQANSPGSQENERVVGILDPDQSFEYHGTRYGAQYCTYQLTWKDHRSIMKRAWDMTGVRIIKFARLVLALEHSTVMDGETFQNITHDWQHWVRWEANYPLTKTKYLAYFGIIVLSSLPVMGHFFDTIGHDLFRGFSTIALSSLILIFGFLITRLQLDNSRKILRQKQESEQFLQRAGVGVTMINQNYEIVYANPLVFNLHGEVIGKKCYEVLRWETSPCPGCGLQKVFKDKCREQAEVKYFTRDGKENWFYVTSTPLFDKYEQVIGMLNISTDITEKKQLEFELAEKQAELETSEAEYRNFMENAADAIVITDLERRLVEASKQFYHLLEIPEGRELQGTNILESVVSGQEDTQKLLSISQAMVRDKSPGQFDLRLECQSGRAIDVEVRAIPIIYEGEVTWMQYIMRDITDRKQRDFEKNLMLSISNAIKDAPGLQELVEHAAQGISEIMQVPIAAIFLKDPDHPQLRLAAHVGLSPEAIRHLTKIAIDGSANDLASRSAILNRPLVISDVAQLKMNSQTRLRLERMGVSSIICMPMVMEEKLQGVIQITSRETDYFSQEKISILSQVANELAVGIARQRLRDALEQKNRELVKKHKELENATMQLLQSEKMASIGQLAAGVAHEINNPMGFINSNLNVLDDYRKDLKKIFHAYETLFSDISRINPKGPIGQQLEQIQEARDEMDFPHLFDDLDALIRESREGAERVKNIILNLKEFSHPSKGEPERADINSGLESTLNIVWNELKYKAEVKKEYGELPRIKCYPRELSQVFMNILINAAQAIENRGEIELRTWNENNHVCIRIQDTGCGMTQEQISKIFDPFYTTKEVGKGTGLGLSISYGIVKKHGGEIKVESEPGKGSAFTIMLPVDGLDSKDQDAERIKSIQG